MESGSPTLLDLEESGLVTFQKGYLVNRRRARVDMIGGLSSDGLRRRGREPPKRRKEVGGIERPPGQNGTLLSVSITHPASTRSSLESVDSNIGDTIEVTTLGAPPTAFHWGKERE